MRKYDKKNKRNLVIVAIIGIILIIVFSLFIKRVIETSKIEYIVEKNTTLLDKEKNAITLNNDGIIKVKWNKDYYLLYNDEQIDLGNPAISYNANKGILNLYGTFYQINENADVVVTEGETSLKPSIVSKFYKISDRKYLLIDKNISSSDNALSTSNYLLVELDKLGNATLTNNEVSLKTFTPTKLITSTYTMDIANELLIYGTNQIDLKKIIGSTNEYKEKETKTNNNATNIDNNGSTNNNTNQNTDVTSVEGGTNITTEEIIELTKRTSIIKVTPSINNISIDYLVYDIKNEYNKVYVEVKNNNTSNINTVYLSKTSTNYVISDLSPNTSYKLTFKYTYTENDEYKVTTFDEISIKTLSPKIDINISKVTNTKIYYEVNLNGNSYNNIRVNLYSDNNLLTYKDYTNVSNNISDSIDITNYTLGNIISVVVDNVTYNGVNVDTNATYKYKNIGE